MTSHNAKSNLPKAAPRSTTANAPGYCERSTSANTSSYSDRSTNANTNNYVFSSPRLTTSNNTGSPQRSLTANSSGFFPSCRFGNNSQRKISRHHAEPPPVTYRFFHRETRDSLFSEMNAQTPGSVDSRLFGLDRLKKNQAESPKFSPLLELGFRI